MNGYQSRYPQEVPSHLKARSIGDLSAAGIEDTLVKFLKFIFEYSALDSENVDGRLEGLARTQTLEGKVPPAIWAGYIPLTITGEIDPERIPKYPSVIVSTDYNEFSYQGGLAAVRLFAGTHDMDKEREGRRDCVNIMETIAAALFSADTIDGTVTLCRSDDATRPIRWTMIKGDTFPFFFAEMLAIFMVPTPTWLDRARMYDSGIMPFHQAGTPKDE